MLKSGDVFKILADTKSVEKLFDNRQFLTWLQFVEDPRRTRMATSLMTSLTMKYGDEALIKVIEAAMKVESTKLVATKLQAQQFKHWAAIGKSPDDVFKLFSLNKAGDSLDNLLSSPRLETWKTYLKVFNQQNPKEQTSLIAAMSKSYGDEAVLKMLESAKGSRRSAVKRLESEQMERWLKMTPDEVFKGLNLDTAAEKMFGSSPLNAWGKYAGKFNSANPDKQTSLIGVLTTHYGDDGVVALLAAAKKRHEEDAVVAMIGAAKKNPSTEKLATKLQTEQIDDWLINKDTPDEIFNALKLDKSVDNLLTHPSFDTWATYMQEFNAKYLSQKDSMIDIFRATFGDKDLAKMLIAAKEVPDTKKVATDLQTALLNDWVRDEVTTAAVSKVLTAGGVAESTKATLLAEYAAKLKETLG
ncbi:hypothetical protein PF010_g27980 [Phytophthora fragariae]|uniref:RxLR effector PexRD54 WY domain-containing protein n=1 Tax=Phytophthora fragariae TaxID=53985 RepID=A0A6G0JSE5_9STRA|nr:hypothetical protein PF010_g27980 [Phytophthora fragariae]